MKFRIRILVPSAIILLSALPISARDYQVGDVAEEDIRTPVPLVIVDRETTDLLKEKETRQMPAIYRYYPRSSNEVEAAFHSTFLRTHSNFLQAVEARFGSRILTGEAVASSDFQRFLTQFQSQNVLFPVGPQLARLWARGDSARSLEAEWIARLREAMKSYVLPDSGPQEIWTGSTIRLVTLTDNETADESVVQERGFNVDRTNFVSAQQVKIDLANSFPAEERAIARYLASFIKPNCMIEAGLTRQLRERQIEGLLATDRYEPGEIIVRRGDIIDKRDKEALEQLKEKTSATERRQAGVTDQEGFLKIGEPWLWLLGMGAGIGLLLIALRIRRKQNNAVSYGPSEEGWRQRALKAEERAEKAQAVIRFGLFRQLSHWMASKLTRKLIWQRAQLINANQGASSEMANLEKRLAKIHAPLQKRLDAYEQRIAELEKELATRGEVNRELIEAKIQMVRKQLEAEKRNRPELN